MIEKEGENLYKFDKRNPFILGIRKALVSDFGGRSIVVRDDGITEFLPNPKLPDADCFINWIQNFNQVSVQDFKSVTTVKSLQEVNKERAEKIENPENDPQVLISDQVKAI